MNERINRNAKKYAEKNSERKLSPEENKKAHAKLFFDPMTKHKQVVGSSNIHSISHNKPKNTTFVTFHKGGEPSAVYAYPGVDMNMVGRILRHDSKGGAFHKLIKSNPELHKNVVGPLPIDMNTHPLSGNKKQTKQKVHKLPNNEGKSSKDIQDELSNDIANLDVDPRIKREEPTPKPLQNKATPKQNANRRAKSVQARDILRESPNKIRWMNINDKEGIMPSFTKKRANPSLFAPLEGSKLAVVLHEIANNYKHDPQLAELARKGLKGAGDINKPNNIFTQIRDKLLQHATGRISSPDNNDRLSKRANDIARGYNWHRVGAGLQVDEAVKDYVNRVARDSLKHRNEQLRSAHNLFGIGSQERIGQYGGAKPEHHNAFWNGLINHVKGVSQGPNSIYGLNAKDINRNMLERSLRRLAEHEENIHGGPSTQRRLTIGRSGGTSLSGGHPGETVKEVPHALPAYSGKLSPKGELSNIRVSPRARAGQYKRRREIYNKTIELLGKDNAN